MNMDDYEVLSILGNSLKSTCYKVKNKKSSEIFVWKGYSNENIPISQNEFMDVASKRKSMKHENLLTYYEPILHNATETVYIVMEYCRYGSLDNILDKCLKNCVYLLEDFIWYVIYTIACLIKSINGPINLNTAKILFDASFTLKLQHFVVTGQEDDSNNNLLSLLNKLLQNNNDTRKFIYSSELRTLLKFLQTPHQNEPEINSQQTIHMILNAILCHPTAIYKSKWNKAGGIFITEIVFDDVKTEFNNQVKQNLPYENVKLENLRKREALLKVNEQKLKEKEIVVEKRERKIALMDRIVKEKSLRADLYLKRCKQDNGKRTKFNQANLTGDYAESVIVTTGKRFNSEKSTKSPKIIRSASERRVRFKSQSPLKEIHNVKRELQKLHKFSAIEECPVQEAKSLAKPLNSDFITVEDKQQNKCELTRNKLRDTFRCSKKALKSSQSLFGGSVSSGESFTSLGSIHTYEDLDDKSWNDMKHELQEIACRPIEWSSEIKKHAFDMLRVMNSELCLEQIEPPVKHTYL